MKYPELRFVYDRKKRAASKGAGVVELEIFFGRSERRYLSTGVKLEPRHWNKERGVVGRLDAGDVNLRLAVFRRPYDEYVRMCMNEGREAVWSEMSAIGAERRGGESFIDWVDMEIERRKDLQESTRKSHRKLVNTLKAYKKIVSFKDITRDSVRRFDAWLHDRKIAQATIHSYHKMLKTYIHRAVAAGLMAGDPYAGFSVPRGQLSHRKYLTEEQLVALRECEVPGWLEKIRDLFVFQAYTGLAYCDLMEFDAAAVKVRDGRSVYVKERRKSGESFYVVLLPPVLELLEKWGGKIPQISNQQYNLRLKAVGECAEIGMPLTSHMARHTAACLFLNKGVPIEIVARILGHSDIKTTKIYAKVLDRSIDEAMDNIDLK